MRASAETVGHTLDARLIVEITRNEMMGMVPPQIINQAVRLAAEEIAKMVVKKWGKKIAKKVALSDIYSLCKNRVAETIPLKRHDQIYYP